MSAANPLAGVLDTITAAAEAQAQREDEYTGEDGLLRCRTCDGPRQVVIEPPHCSPRTVRCDCGCRRAEEEKRQMDWKDYQKMQKRRRCFKGTDMAGWSFANDDRAKPELSDAMQRYADKFADYLKSGQGLLLYGPVGTGKTYLAACIANRVIDLGYTARMGNFSQVTDNLQSTWNKQEYIQELCDCDLLVIDDLGTERKTDYMQEQVYKVIDARYRSGRPLIVTSNLTQEELGNPANIEAQRIYDRVLERCLPVKVEGKSRRRQTARTSWTAMREELGM